MELAALTTLAKNNQISSLRELNEVVAQLPALPSIIRYYDEFNDKHHSIHNPSKACIFKVKYGGRSLNINFEQFSENYRLLLKHVFVFLLSENLNISTVTLYLLGAKHLTHEDANELLRARPIGISQLWITLLARAMPTPAYHCAKALIRLLCQHRLAGWSDSYHEFLTTTLPYPATDKYAGVRSGDVFLSTEEEAAIVRYIDEAVCTLATSSESLFAYENLSDATMLVCAYQFGMRPIQIAMLTIRDVRIWEDSVSEPPTVHLTFRMVKQRHSATTKPLLRRVKREWASLFVDLYRRAQERGFEATNRIFDVQSGYEAGSRIASLVRKLIGGDMATMDLRHTAAQRLVDAGASQEELAEFLGHSDITTGLVYFETSANQAERVNKALGISEIYQRVSRIAHDRFISAEELALLKEEQQIGGMPHGIAIAGIGGCSSGQPACPYNPVMSCYGCKKFMPIHEVKIHEQVLMDFREIVRFFHDASRGDTTSPAYLQLQRTIAEVQAVINEIEGNVA